MIQELRPKKKIPALWIGIAVIMIFIGYILGVNDAEKRSVEAEKAQELKVDEYRLEPGDNIMNENSPTSNYRFAGFLDMNTIVIQEIPENSSDKIILTYYQHSNQSSTLNIPVKDGKLKIKEADSTKNRIVIEWVKKKE